MVFCTIFFLICSWVQLQDKLAVYRAQLRAALEVHAYNRDVDELCDRIQEKYVAVSSDDLGKDLHSVETLIRKQDAVERDMTVILERLKVEFFHINILFANDCVMLLILIDKQELRMNCNFCIGVVVLNRTRIEFSLHKTNLVSKSF